MTGESTLAGIAGTGVVGGLVLLGRGLIGHRAAGRISGMSPSRIERLESIIADRRERYVDPIYRHDTRISQVMAVFLADLFGWTSRACFDAEPGATTVPAGLATGAGAGDREGDHGGPR